MSPNSKVAQVELFLDPGPETSNEAEDTKQPMFVFISAFRSKVSLSCFHEKVQKDIFFLFSISGINYAITERRLNVET